MNPLALFLLHFIARLPLPLLHGVGTLLGWLSWLIPNPNRDVAQRNIALCYPALTPRQRRRLLRLGMVELGKALLETPTLWLTSGRRTFGLVREVRGEELVRQAMAAGRGLIIIAPHLGNWELCSLYLARYGITSLYRPLRQQNLEPLIRAGRERLGAILVPTTASGIRSLYQALARGGMIGVPPDQDPRDQGGVFAPFFGVACNTMTLLPRLAHKSGAAMLYCFAERLSWGRGFRLHFLPAPAAIAGADVTAAATALNEGVEECVRIAPAQYQWAYKRFRTRPEGEPSVYR